MLTYIDWILIVAYLVISLVIGLRYSKQAGKDLSSYFLGGRNLSWWLAGLSMVATTFAADTPLAVAEIVGNNGISGNWLWWCFLSGGMLTTFFFANLWRRAEVLTEVELIELRYAGRAAAFLRGFKAIYLGLFMNMLIIAWVNVALMTLLQGIFGISQEAALLYCGAAMLLTTFYASLSGLMGVAVTDALQFVIAMLGCVVLAVWVVNSPEIGGIDGLIAKAPAGSLNFLPVLGSSDSNTMSLSMAAFVAFFGMMWWASWYPGAEPGGGGYVAQRFMSAKNERHAVLATLFFQIAHYCLRPWPWILVGLCAISLYNIPNNVKDTALRSEIQQLQQSYPAVKDEVFIKDAAALDALAQSNPAIAPAMPQIKQISSALRAQAANDKDLQEALTFTQNKRLGYIYAMKDYLSAGWLGLLLVAFLAAYMSTIATQLNWGAGYLVNDLYHRFVNPNASQTALVMMSRLATLLLMGLGLLTSLYVESISGVWQFMMECGAGLGLVLILRWYWWRINVWSEITASIAPFVAYAFSKFILKWEFPYSFFFTVSFTTIAWLTATFLTAPEPSAHLLNFYKKVRPDGAWAPMRALTGASGEYSRNNLWYLGMAWLASVVMIYAILLLTGKLIFKQWTVSMQLAGVAVVAFIVLQFALGKTRILK